jgi:hypothetical protein
MSDSSSDDDYISDELVSGVGGKGEPSSSLRESKNVFNPPSEEDEEDEEYLESGAFEEEGRNTKLIKNKESTENEY